MGHQEETASIEDHHPVEKDRLLDLDHEMKQREEELAHALQREEEDHGFYFINNIFNHSITGENAQEVGRLVVAV